MYGINSLKQKRKIILCRETKYLLFCPQIILFFFGFGGHVILPFALNGSPGKNKKKKKQFCFHV